MPNATEPRSDDDIQFLSWDHPTKVICQFCTKDLSIMTLPQKEFHYDQHFEFSEDDPHPQGVVQDFPARSGMSVAGGAGPSKPPSTSASKPQLNPSSKFLPKSAKPVSKSGFKGQSLIFRTSPEEKNIFWHSSQTSEPPVNFSPGLIPVLKKALTRLHDRRVTQRAWLTFEQSVHVRSEIWDTSWGCGYRNYLMACAALMDQQVQPMYFPLLDAPVSPGIRNLQIVLERAWRDGYDEEGARQLNRKLVDTTKWIGTAELYVAFSYRGIPTRLVDFELKNGVDPLLQWIHHYFSGDTQQQHGVGRTVGEALRGARPVIVTDKLPIILQHNGHSRTIIGCMELKGGALQLLTFDPARKIPQDIRQAGLKSRDPTRLDEPSTTSKALQKVKHTVENIKPHKRKSPESHTDSFKKKRVDDDSVIVITDDEKESSVQPPRAHADDVDPMHVLKVFRIDPKTLNKQNKYQILYFPLEEPLTDAQKWNRRIVTSEKDC